MFNHDFQDSPAPAFKKRRISPAQTITLAFLLVIIVGTIFLSLPQASKSGVSFGLMNSFFTATSATCVTALTLVDTAEQFTLFGQTVILILMQIGGLGIMAVSTLLFLILGKRISFYNRITLQESFNQNSMSGIVKLTKNLILTTLCIEGIGALLLAIRFSFDMPLSKAAYFGVFHSISAFCNAGFSLFGSNSNLFINLSSYSGDYLVRSIFMILIVLGGLGFPVLMEFFKRKENTHRKSLHTKVVLTLSAVLIFVGAILFLLFEFNNPATIGNMGIGEKIFNSFFTSITLRTAGFGIGNIASLRSVTFILSIILMFIGVSPSSTGGGIKTTTFGVLVASVWSTIRGYDETMIFKRRIPQETINKALTITVLSITVLIMGIMMISLFEDISLSNAILEATSALSTTGLSSGITSTFSNISLIILSCMMFIGRLGPITVAVALSQRSKKSAVHYPEEKLIIG